MIDISEVNGSNFDELALNVFRFQFSKNKIYQEFCSQLGVSAEAVKQVVDIPFLPISFFNHIFILGKQLVLWIFMLISPTPGASGIAEFAFGELMGEFSSSILLIVVLAVIWRLISYFPYLILGSILLPKWLQKKA